MFRSLTVIIAAILLAQPTMSRNEAARYAEALQREAKEHGFDPFTGVALIRRESRWSAGAVSPDGEDYGLGQIRARFVGACRSDADPLNAPSEACQAVKRSLLDGVYNIRVMATLITRNRDLCKDKTGSARFGQWLASYEGRNYPDSKKWCQPSEATHEVIRYREWLVSRLVNGARTPSPTAKATPSAKKRDKRSGAKQPAKQRAKQRAKKAASAHR